jgi:hypothetical protein
MPSTIIFFPLITISPITSAFGNATVQLSASVSILNPLVNPLKMRFIFISSK